METNDLNRGGDQAALMADGKEQMADSQSMASEQCVPLEALQMPGQDEKLVSPEMGDPVSYQVEGKVSRIEGGMAYVTPETVNGKAVTSEAAKTTDDPDADERQELYSMAAKQDSPGGMMGGGQ